MKRINILVLFVYLAQWAQSQPLQYITGVVIDENKVAVQNALVTLTDRQKSGFTDSQGKFSISVNGLDISGGQLVGLTVCKAGYERKMYNRQPNFKGVIYEDITLPSMPYIYVILRDAAYETPVSGANISCGALSFGKVIEYPPGFYSIPIKKYEPDIRFTMYIYDKYKYTSYDTTLTLKEIEPTIEFLLVRRSGDEHYYYLIHEFGDSVARFRNYVHENDTIKIKNNINEQRAIFNAIRDLSELSPKGNANRREFHNSFNSYIENIDNYYLTIRSRDPNGQISLYNNRINTLLDSVYSCGNSGRVGEMLVYYNQIFDYGILLFNYLKGLQSPVYNTAGERVVLFKRLKAIILTQTELFDTNKIYFPDELKDVFEKSIETNLDKLRYLNN